MTKTETIKKAMNEHKAAYDKAYARWTETHSEVDKAEAKYHWDEFNKAFEALN